MIEKISTMKSSVIDVDDLKAAFAFHLKSKELSAESKAIAVRERTRLLENYGIERLPEISPAPSPETGLMSL